MNRLYLSLCVAAACSLSQPLLAAEAEKPADQAVEEIQVEGTAESLISPAAVPLGIRFSGEELMRVPGAGGDVLRALDSLPGIAVNEDGGGDVSIRGSRPENNRYYVDFMPSGYLFHFTGNSVVDGDLVKQFDLYPAGYGAEFQGSMGGVLEVETRDPSIERKALLDISLLEAGVLLEGEINETQSAFFSARMSYYDLFAEDFIDDEDDEFDIIQLPKFFDYRGKYLVELENNKRLQFFIDGADDEFEFILGENADEVIQDPVLAGRYAINVNYHRQGVTLDGATDSGGLYTVGLSNRLSTTGVQEGGAGNVNLDINTTNLKSEYEFPDMGRHQITVGSNIERVYADYDVSYRDTGCTEFDVECRASDAEVKSAKSDLTVMQGAVYAQDRLSLNNGTALILGVGVNGDDYLDQSNVEPRLRIEKTLDNDMVVSAAVGKYYEFPDFAEVEKTFGNPALKYQESDHYVLGLSQDREDGWFWKAETYYKTLEKLVTSDDAVNYLNLGEGSAQGVEFFLKKEFDERWAGWLSLSWSESERKDLRTGKTFDFEYDQPIIASLVASRKLNEKWSLSTKAKFNSGAPYTPILGGVPDENNPGSFKAVYGDINSKRLPDYFRLDIRADYSPRPDAWSWYGELINATFHKNLSGYDYNADYTVREDVEQIPFLINFGFKFPFK